MKFTASIPKGLCHKYLKILNQQLGKSTGRKVFEEFKLGYGKLYLTRETYENKALNHHLVRNILPGISLYEAFLSYSQTTQGALVLFEAFNCILYEKTAFAYKILGRLPLFFGLLRILSSWSMSVTYPCDGWTTQWIENSSSRIAFDVSRCYYQDTLMKYNHAELLPCFCRIDDELYENISRRVKWQRTQTLGRGGNTCDFRFILEKKKHENK